MSTSRFAAALLALVLGATACTSTGDDPSATPTTDLGSDEIVLTSALVTVDSCDDLLDRLRAEGTERVGPYGFSQGHFGPEIMPSSEDGDMAADEAASEAFASTATTQAVAPAGEGADSSARLAADTEASGSVEGEDFSGTNNQEEGVDEADLVKTDGERLIVVSGNRLEVIDVTGSTPELVDTIRLPEEFYGGELFLSGDTALLMTSGWTAEPFLRGMADLSWYPGSPTGRLVEVDLDAGKVRTTMDFEGAYLSAREIDGSIRIVLTAAENRFDFVYPSNPGAEDTAEEANKALIAESTIDMWLPTYRITDGSGVVSEGPIVDCDRVHLPNQFAGFGSLVILTVDIDDGLRVEDSLSVFTDAQTIYASPEMVAATTPRWPEMRPDGTFEEDDDYRTAIHTFDISEPGRTTYTASGTVRGTVLNRFSLSEHQGYLRVATTDGTPWDSRGSESFVTVLAEEGRELVQVGQVGGLGKGEQIFAVRFLGDMGYVVTFEQIDPLYTIDLSDPTDPVTRGELKIPGFSQYLHPYGDLLIGIGTDGDDTGRTFGAVASLFDVSDPDDPQLVDKVALAPGQSEDFDWFDSQSGVAWDARAFTQWGDTILVPVSWWGAHEGNAFEEVNGSAVTLLRIDDDTGSFSVIGRVGHPVVSECEGKPMPVEPGEVVVEPAGGTTEGGFFGGSDETTDDEATDEVEPEREDAEASFAREAEEEPAQAAGSAPAPDGEWCWSYQPEIRRSVIIGDELYTVSDSGVAVNDFSTLRTIAWIPFEQR